MPLHCGADINAVPAIEAPRAEPQDQMLGTGIQIHETSVQAGLAPSAGID